jgi:hypothetical protein
MPYRKPWRFTERRKASLRKARKVHSELVALGKRMRARSSR